MALPFLPPEIKIPCFWGAPGTSGAPGGAQLGHEAAPNPQLPQPGATQHRHEFPGLSLAMLGGFSQPPYEGQGQAGATQGGLPCPRHRRRNEVRAASGGSRLLAVPDAARLAKAP